MRCAAVLMALSLSSCQSDGGATDGGTGAASVQLVFRPTGEPSGVSLEGATSRFEEILLVSDSGEDAMTGAEIDLLAAETVLAVEDASPGLYSRVRLKLGPDDEETLTIDARLGVVPVELRAREDDEVDLLCPEGERLDPGGQLRIDVAVDRSRWLSAVDLGSAEVEDGVIALDPDDGENRKLAENVVESVLESFSIGGTSSHGGSDGDADGPDEDGPDEDGGPEDGGED